MLYDTRLGLLHMCDHNRLLELLGLLGLLGRRLRQSGLLWIGGLPRASLVALSSGHSIRFR